jgi:hypothetical protein
MTERCLSISELRKSTKLIILVSYNIIYSSIQNVTIDGLLKNGPRSTLPMHESESGRMQACDAARGFASFASPPSCLKTRGAVAPAALDRPPRRGGARHHSSVISASPTIEFRKLGQAQTVPAPFAPDPPLATGRQYSASGRPP